MSNFVETCNPDIENCESARTLVDSGSYEATIGLGVIALLKFVVPIFLKQSSSTSIYAMSVWYISNSLIWGLLTTLWPLSYF